MRIRPSFAALRALAGGALLVLGPACAGGWGGTYPANAPAREARDAPDRFSAHDPASGAAPAADPAPGVCRNPMWDPRDGTRLRLVSSQGGLIGDYAVPPGRYGVGAGELLRLECGTGRVIGVVPGRG